MNAIINLNSTTSELTMSSREIAELTGKQHRNVVRDIRTMLAALDPESMLKFEHTYVNPQNGQEYIEFHLPKDLTITLVSGYRVDLRHRIVTRWLELEEQPKVQLPDFTNPAIAARAWADEVKQKLIAQQHVEIKF